MKKILLTISAVCLSAGLFAGGLVTNTNHSAAFTRMQCRDATLGADAAYFNPAGTVMMDKGIHFSVSNQTITQTRSITTNFPTVAGQPKEYTGTIFAPVFPAVYGVLNLGKVAVSAGFNPIGGGGGATFEDGIPSIEYDPSLLVPGLAASGVPVTGYSLEANFEASSVYFGYQLNIAYKVNDMLSVAVGGRYVTASNTYDGYLRNVNLVYGGVPTAVADVFTDLSTQAAGGAALADGASTSMDPIIAGGYGGMTTAELVTNGIITQPTADQLNGGLVSLGVDPTGLTAAQMQGAYDAAAVTLTATSAEMAAKSSLYGALFNQTAQVEQRASGFAPIISVNFSPIEMLNIAIKYEGATKLEFTNETTSDFITAVDPVTGAPTASMFPDGYTYNADIPAQLVVGATLKPIDKLLISAGVHTFFDKKVDYSSGMDIEMIDRNFISYSLGAEYAVSDALRVSAGWGGTSTGVNELYQSDIRHSLNTSTFGGGFAFKVTPMIDINLAGAFTSYAEDSFDFTKTPPVGSPITFTETYDRSVWLVAVGVDLHF